MMIMMMTMMMMQSFMSSDDILGTNCDQCLSMVQYCFTSTEQYILYKSQWEINKVYRNRKAHEDGKSKTTTATFTQLLNSDLSGTCINTL